MGVSILPHREDGASYSGVLTFTATEPVEIGFSHRLHVDNSTLSQFDAETLDDLLLGQQNNRTEKDHLVLLLSRLLLFLIMEPNYHTSLHLFLVQQAQYSLEHHMVNHLSHSMRWLLM